MHFVLKILTALLCILLAASPAGAGSMLLLGEGKAGGAALSPVTLTFQASGIGASAGSTNTFGTLTLGAAPSANRRVVVFSGAPDLSTGANLSISSAVFTPNAGGTVSADTTIIVGQNATEGLVIVSAILPLGTTTTLTVTYPNPAFSGPRFAFYTVDNSTLSSPLSPVTAYVTNTGTSVTTTVNTLSGGGLLALYSNGGTFTAGIAGSDASFGPYLWGSISNTAAATPFSVTGTGASNLEALGLVAYR